jgi:Peptidase family M28
MADDTLGRMIALPQIRRRAIAAVALAAATAALAEPVRSSVLAEVERASQTVTASDLAAHLRVLASDDMQGRALEGSGNDRAAEYVADALKRLRVASAFPDSYFQNFGLFDAALGLASALELHDERGGRIAHLAPGADFYPAQLSAGGTVTAASTSKEEDAKGKILFIQLGAGELCESRALSDRVDTAIVKGAIGVVAGVRSLEPIDEIWRVSGSTAAAEYQPSEVAEIPVACVIDSAAGSLRPRHETDRLTITADIARRPVPARNVVAALEGADPTRRAELVVIGAHLDHDGVDPKRGVMNGADDDGSGVAAVLEVAEAFAAAAAAHARPARTVVFGFWNAEELGLFGSRYFVAHPAPPGRPVANLNLDMVGRHEDVPDPSNPRFSGLPETHARDTANVLHVLGYSHSPDLTAAIRKANEHVRLDVRTSYDGGSHNLLRRSDQWSFLERGIPALFLTTGLHPDYHTPEDDVDKIDFEKLARVARVTFEAAWRLADAPATPKFVP